MGPASLGEVEEWNGGSVAAQTGHTSNLAECPGRQRDGRRFFWCLWGARVRERTHPLTTMGTSPWSRSKTITGRSAL